MNQPRIRLGLLVLALTTSSVASADDNTIQLRSVRGYHLGGEQVELRGLPVTEITPMPGSAPRRSDPNGYYQVGQIYVQRFELAAPRGVTPMLLWHGGGLTGATWEDKPDGGRGWHDFFMRRGWDTYISDSVERGRASWARYPEINPAPPEHRPIDQAWSIFRFGPDGGYNVDPGKRQAFAGLRFPVGAADQFEKQFVARWTTSSAMTLRGYDVLVQHACPCVVVAHSQGAQFAQDAAINAPEKIRALVLIEPAGAPDPAKAASVRGIPILIVWGDNIQSSAQWKGSRANVERWATAVRQAGGRVDVIDLPSEGIKGNSHMIMMDENSDEVAGKVQEWLAANRLFQ